MDEPTRTLAGLGLTAQGRAVARITGLSVDSRETAPGHLFAALPGSRAHGAEYVPAALAAGAVAILTDREGARLAGAAIHEAGAALVVAEDPRQALAYAAALWFGDTPGTLAAVTGTNGKTSVATFTRQIWQAMGEVAVNLGTTGVEGDWDAPLRHTTPEPITLHRTLAAAFRAGVTHAAMEASSHGLDQRRLDGVALAAAAFTNFTQDHLDFHGDEASYLAAKLRLVELVDPSGTLVVNGDEPAWEGLDPKGRAVRTFSLEGRGDVRATELDLRADGSRFVLEAEGRGVPVHLPLLGRYNVENALAAAAIALSAGMEPGEVARGLEDAPTVPGRLQVVHRGAFTVLVDFAHTPDALENVLAALRPVTEGRLVVLFGAGGDRDRTKRAPMARAVARGADVVVLTSDNPRTEDPERILDDLAEGLGGAAHHREVDRRRAIGLALDLARPGDTVLLAGKGHETYQVVGTEKQPFDEAAVVARHLARTDAEEGS